MWGWERFKFWIQKEKDKARIPQKRSPEFIDCNKAAIFAVFRGVNLHCSNWRSLYNTILLIEMITAVKNRKLQNNSVLFLESFVCNLHWNSARVNDLLLNHIVPRIPNRVKSGFSACQKLILPSWCTAADPRCLGERPPWRLEAADHQKSRR